MIGKRLLRFSAKAFVFGVDAALAVAGAIAAVDWYSNRPVVPPREYPEIPIANIGIKYKLTTNWQDGKMYYIFSTAPLDKSLAEEFDRAARSDAPKSFYIHLQDPEGFNIPDCELDITALSPTVAENGLVVSIDAQGSSSACSRSEYLCVRSARPSYLFPTIKKDVSLPIEHGPWEKYGSGIVQKPKKETQVGLEATITCDVILYDRDEYAAGNPEAIESLHTGETVEYIGHATVSGWDIIRIHGRKGFAPNCVSVTK